MNENPTVSSSIEAALRARKMSKLIVGKSPASKIIRQSNHSPHNKHVEADIYYKVIPATNTSSNNGPTSSSSKKQVVLLMGLLGRGDAWELFQTNYFANAGFTVLILDNRGTGQSSTTPGRYTTKTMAHDCYDVLCHLNWSSYHVVGCSMGGMIAQELALIAPTNVCSLSLLSTHAGGWRALPPLRSIYVMLKNMCFTTDVDERQHNSMTLLYDSMTLTDPTRYQHLFELGVTQKKTYGVASLAAFISQTSAVFSHRVTADRFATLVSHQVPVLVVTGTRDEMVRPSNSHSIARMCNVEPEVWQACGHHLIWECPEKINDRLRVHFEESVLSSRSE